MGRSADVLVYGAGLNDADYQVYPKGGVRCPFYQRWVAVLERAYSKKEKLRHKTYESCTMSKDWHSFMAFREWMVDQDWHGKHIDKDLLVEGNKEYGPDTCVFVTAQVNQFLVDSGAARGAYPIGVSYEKDRNKYSASIGCRGKKKKIGSFHTPDEAHKAYCIAKYDQAVQLASEQTDSRVAEALIKRYKLS